MSDAPHEPTAEPDWRFVGDQIAQTELADRAAGRWLTGSAGLLLLASVVGVAIAAAFIASDQPALVQALLVGGLALGAIAGALSAMALLTGGDAPEGADRLGGLVDDLRKGSDDAVDRYVERSLGALRAQEERKQRRARLLRFAAALLVLALLVGAAAVAATAVEGRDSEGAESQPPTEPEAAKLGTDSDRELAERFRPVLLFDRGERWRPLDVSRFFEEGIHRVCGDRQSRSCAQVSDTGGLRAFNDDDSSLHVNGLGKLVARRFRSPIAECRAKRAYECERGERSRIYYHVLRRGGRTYIDYWWYLRFNDAPARRYDHQSDWEGVVVAVDERRPRTFDWVGFAAHEGVWRYFREDLRCEGSPLAGSCGSETRQRFGARVNVYVANGTHAAYPAPCRAGPRLGERLGLCVQSDRIPFRLLRRFRTPERGFNGKVRWAANDDDAALVPLPKELWPSWPGRWDPTRRVRSPARQARYRSPESTRPADCPRDLCPRAVPRGYEAACYGWFGPAAVATACDPARLRQGTGSGTASFSLRRARIDGDEVIADLDDTLAASSPGVAQVSGGYLGPGEAVVLDGVAPATTELYLRARQGGDLLEARFDELGLTAGGRAVAQVVGTSDGLRLELRRPDGRTAAPQQTVVLGAD